MTVNTTNITSGPYVGNGVADTFSYTFRITDKAQVSVYETDTDGVQTLLAVDTDYTVAGIGDDDGGTITRVAGALPTDYEWFIRSNYKETQLTAFESQGAYFPDLHENMADKLTFLIQQLRDTADRTFRISDVIDNDGIFALTQDAAARSNLLLGFDSSGNLTLKSLVDAGSVLDESDLDARHSVVFATLTVVKSLSPVDINGNPISLSAGLTVRTQDYDATQRKGGGVYKVKTSTEAATDGDVIDGYGNHTLANGNVLVLQELHPTQYQYGAKGDDSTNDTNAVGAWFDYHLAKGLEVKSVAGIYLMDSMDKAAPSGIKISGQGTFKCTGSTKLNFIRFTQVRGPMDVDGVTFDGDNIAARAFEAQNSASTPATQGSVHIREGVRFINSRNNAPDTFTATGCYVRGGFTEVLFEGEIDGVDSTSTSGASSDGLGTTFFTTNPDDDWIKSVVISSKARIRNVKNSNTVLADADGCRIFAPTDKIAALTVAPGALFENCKGRSIKSQVVDNSIIAPVIRRSLYDGLTEINLQYAGGCVMGAKVYHEGTRCNTVIGVTQRPTPGNTHCSITGNQLTVTGTPSGNTGVMVSTDVTDASVKVQGVTIRDNKVKGTVDYMTAHRVANVVDVNRVVVDGNWAEDIGIAFVNTTLFGSSRAQCSIVFINNGCENPCAGGSITQDLIVEYARNNHNIDALLTNPFNIEIATGVVTAHGATHRVSTESGASTDDLDTINTNRIWEPDEWLTLYANNSGDTVVVKDGTGNINLAGGDFSLTHVSDRLVLAYDANTSEWVEISRSDNAA